MSTSGPNGLAGLWPALDAALTNNKIKSTALQEAQREQAGKQTQESALGALLRGLQSGDTGGPVMPQIAQQKLGNLAFPEQAAARAQEKLFPAIPKPMVVPKDSRVVLPGPNSSFTTALDAAPDVPDILKPGVLDAEIKKAVASRSPESNAESWQNPVSEIGPDGKPISVRYGSKGGRQVVDGATPSRQGNPFDRQDYWRTQTKPLVDSATNARVQANKVRTNLALNTGTGHIAAINAVQKMIDEGAVVRDQDVALIQSAQSLLGRMGAEVSKLQTGKLLSADLQTELQGVTDALEGAIYQGADERIGGFAPIMQEEGVNVDSVVPPSIRKYMSAAKKQTPDASEITEGSTATNKKTGQKLIYRGGQWQPVQ